MSDSTPYAPYDARGIPAMVWIESNEDDEEGLFFPGPRPDGTTDRHARNVATVAEGFCPVADCGAALERDGDYGRCPNGHGRWQTLEDIGFGPGVGWKGKGEYPL